MVNEMEKISKFSVIADCDIAEDAIIRDHVNLYKCKIGHKTKIDSFVYIEEGVSIGENCKIRPFTFIPAGVTIGNNVFIGPNVTFTNDKYPRIGTDWKLLKTTIYDRVSIGAGSVILPGVEIGEGSLIGSGSTVIKSVPPNSVVVGEMRFIAKKF